MPSGLNRRLYAKVLIKDKDRVTSAKPDLPTWTVYD